MSITYEGPPQYSLHYATTVVGRTANASSMTMSSFLASNDPGVFVIPAGHDGATYLSNNGSAVKPHLYAETPTRANGSSKYINNTSSCITGGVVNMANQYSCYQITMGQHTTITVGSDPVAIIGIEIYHDTMVHSNRIIPVLASDCGVYAYMSDNVGDKRQIALDVERTEFGWNHKELYHHTGVTGFTVYSQVSKKGGIRLPSNYGPFETWANYTRANNAATKSLIFCRIIPTDGSLKGMVSNGYPNTSQCENSFVVFDGLCDFVLGNSFDNSSIGEPITKLVPSFDADQIKSNTGMLAVAMMAKGATKAYYLGYKNGVYKLYNGSQPYIMPPGSIVNIGKIKFQSIAYSSYFVRMN